MPDLHAATMTVTVTIGRNVGASPMPLGRWRTFRASVLHAIGHPSVGAATALHVDGAVGEGLWDGIVEQNATWIAEVPAERLPALRTALAVLARAFRQDAIALTVGQTELIAP